MSDCEFDMAAKREALSRLKNEQDSFQFSLKAEVLPPNNLERSQICRAVGNCFKVLLRYKYSKSLKVFARNCEAKDGRGCLLKYLPTQTSNQQWQPLSESEVCRHHVYKGVWFPYIGEKLVVQCKASRENDTDLLIRVVEVDAHNSV